MTKTKNSFFEELQVLCYFIVFFVCTVMMTKLITVFVTKYPATCDYMTMIMFFSFASGWCGLQVLATMLKTKKGE